jgi:hypothetical protein
MPLAPGEAEQPGDRDAHTGTMAGIGKGARWYDLPYRVLSRLLASRIGGKLPKRWRRRIHTSTNFMFQAHHAERGRQKPAPQRWGAINLPEGERVLFPGVWVVEFFTASQVARLYKAIRREGWSDSRSVGNGARGVESLSASRGGRGYLWWRIAGLRSRNSVRYGLPGAQVAALPRGVDSVDLFGVSVGRGITAIVAGFTLDESGSARLNQELHARHEFAVIRRPGSSASAQPPNAVLYNRVQLARADIHEEMRRWMSKSIPGKFAHERWHQPICDLVFFNVADPFDEQAHDLRRNDALRAVGITGYERYFTSSDEFPGLLLELPQGRGTTPDLTDNVWTLWGNRNAISGLTSGGDGSDEFSAAYAVGTEIVSSLAHSGLTAMLRSMRADASRAHDNARQLHGGASSRNLRRLRERLLTTSLDLATLEADIQEYNEASNLSFFGIPLRGKER